MTLLSPHWSRLALALILLGGVLFRILPIEYGKPGEGFFSADEIDSVSRAVQLGRGDLMPIHANKPTLYPAIVAVVYGVEFIGGKVSAGWTVDDYQRRFFMEPFGFYRGARAVAILASVCTLILLLAFLRPYGLKAQVAGLLILGFGRSSVYYGHVAKEDSLAAMLVLAAMGLAVSSWRKTADKQRTFFLLTSSLCAGLSVSTKYNCFFAPLFPLVALMQIRFDTYRKWMLLIGVITCGAFAFFLGTPYALLHPVDFVRQSFGSAITEEIAGNLDNIHYIDSHGLAFLAKMYWREFGLMITAAGAAIVIFFKLGKGQPRLLLGLPSGIYFALLFITWKLDYQYLLPLTPLAAWMTGVGIFLWDQQNSEAEKSEHSHSSSPIFILLFTVLVLGACVNVLFLTRTTATYLGGDTRNEAAAWMRENTQNFDKPILIVSPYYFRYYPSLDFTAETYERLEEQTLQAGGSGEFYRQAAIFAHREGEDRAFEADFLPVSLTYRVKNDGNLEFEEQPFSTNWNDYKEQYSFVIIPDVTLQLMEPKEAELQGFRDFLQEIRSLPQVAEFHPSAWKMGGPSLYIFACER